VKRRKCGPSLLFPLPTAPKEEKEEKERGKGVAGAGLAGGSREEEESGGGRKGGGWPVCSRWLFARLRQLGGRKGEKRGGIGRKGGGGGKIGGKNHLFNLNSFHRSHFPDGPTRGKKRKKGKFSK